jgi:hypothetical protein
VNQTQHQSFAKADGEAFPSKTSVAFFAVLAAAELFGASQAGDRPSPPRTISAHLAAADDYRAKAALKRREAERQRVACQGEGAAASATARQAWFEDRCQKLAATADEMALIEMELATYQDEQAARIRPALLP